MHHRQRFTSQAVTLAGLVLFACAGSDSIDDPASPTVVPSTIPKELQCSGEADTSRCRDPSLDNLLCYDDPGIPLVWPSLGNIDIDAGDAAEVTLPEPGRVCMSGSLSAESQGAQLFFTLSRRAALGTRVIGTFDAQALGVTALRFKLDLVPSTRMSLGINVVMACECPDPSTCALGGAYLFATPDHAGPVTITESGTITAALADFVPLDLNEQLPGSHPLSSVFLSIEPVDQAIDYEFCVSELEFLDAAGNRVLPPA